MGGGVKRVRLGCLVPAAQNMTCTMDSDYASRHPGCLLL